jgi:hypothetical protein
MSNTDRAVADPKPRARIVGEYTQGPAGLGNTAQIRSSNAQSIEWSSSHTIASVC